MAVTTSYISRTFFGIIELFHRARMVKSVGVNNQRMSLWIKSSEHRDGKL